MKKKPSAKDMARDSIPEIIAAATRVAGGVEFEGDAYTVAVAFLHQHGIKPIWQAEKGTVRT